MKKMLLIMALFIFTFTMPNSADAVQYDLRVNGSSIGIINFNGQAPGGVLLPVRPVFETMGWQVKYNAQNHYVTLTKDNTTINLFFDKLYFIMNEKQLSLEYPIILKDQSSYIPLVFFNKNNLCRVNWDGRLKALHLSNQ